MYSAPLGGLCPCRPGADFTLARITIKTSVGVGDLQGVQVCACCLDTQTSTPSHPIRPPSFFTFLSNHT